MSHATLQTIWYLLIGVLIAGYAILDGFDLGVGVLSPFVAKTDGERRSLFAAVGPFWDGNEVWLLTAGGALFAAFPHAYATVFSGFYLALMLVLFALILRAVSFEFRSKVESPRWRSTWDWVFCIGSLLPALLTGVAVGNIMRGVPVDASMEYAGNFFTLLNPLSLLIGLAGLAMFVHHGALYLLNRTDGPVAQRARQAANVSWIALIALMVVSTVIAIFDMPARFDNYIKNPVAFLVPILAVAALVVSRLSLKRSVGRAFVFSALGIAGLVGIFGVGNFPYLLPARNVVANSLTVYSASASRLTLNTMFTIAIIGVPIMIAYTSYVYYAFRGKVKVEDSQY
jgi:cytochrome bd ubiquinol oxidase subunit II